jgi:CubicO group peptidase (beta-lactamase class C family)
MKNFLIIVLTGFVLPFPKEVYAQIDAQKLDNYFTRKMQKAQIIGLQVASIGNGELVWYGSYGVKEMNTTNAVNDSTLFMIASCSKPVTALGIMKLYDQGKIDLDDDINNYLPFNIINPNYPEKKITFRMLLTHTSSIRDNWDVLWPTYTLPDGGDSPLELHHFVQDYFVKGGKYFSRKNNFANEKPGNHYTYCNMGFSLLGVLTEQISGESFNQYIAKEIFRPLHMNDSYWFLKEISHDNIAHPHETIPKKEPEILNHYGYASYPDGQLRTTASDYAQILKLIINKGKVDGQTFIRKQTVDEFMEIQFPDVAKHQAIAWCYSEFSSFLYYFMVPGNLFKRRLPSHSGADPGVETAVSFDPKRKTGAIIFINSPTLTFKSQSVYYRMINKLFRIGKKS